jgi:hypothetical protein
VEEDIPVGIISASLSLVLVNNCTGKIDRRVCTFLEQLVHHWNYMSVRVVVLLAEHWPS